MTFEDILARCLDALERGDTIEHCIARYPEHAAELSSLLNLAVAVRSTPQPRLSVSAFARGHATVIAQIRLQQAQQAPFTPTQRAAARKLARQVVRVQPMARKKFIAQPPPLAKPFLFIYKAQSVFIASLVVLSLFTLLRNLSISLPGATLYPVKILGENMEGVLLAAAGQQAIWHAQQAENRLQELVQLAQQDQIASIELEQTINEQVLATLATSNQWPAERRNQFLLAWLTRLHTLDKDKAWPSTVARTLDRTLATLQSATQVTVVLPTPAPEIIQTIAPTPTDFQVSVPTATSNPGTAEPQLVEQATSPAVEATVPAEPVVIHPTTVSPDLAPALPTELATPTMASIIVQVPQATPADDDHQPKHANKAAVAQPEQTTTPVVAAANMQLPDNRNDNAQATVLPLTSMTTSVTTGPEKASSADHVGKADVPTATVTPAFGIVDAPTPANESGPAIAPASTLVTEAATLVTPEQTAVASTGTPSSAQTSLPTRSATVAATLIAIPSSIAANTTTPTPAKTPASEPEATVEPTATSAPTEPPKPSATVKPTEPDPTNTPEQSETSEAKPPTSTPESTPTPKKHK